MTWQSRVFDNLMLSADHKDLVLGFADCHRGTEDDEFDDFIEGKGRSLIFLLSGPSGVGKTLTAEAGRNNYREVN
jgi:SpoVK/Ycf46/Vps4 family AAA+-type ATPase